MSSRRSQFNVIKVLIYAGFLYMVLGMSLADDPKLRESTSEDDVIPNEVDSAPEKRYLAALAKNGRLPKFQASNQKKDGSDQNLDGALPEELAINMPNSAWVEQKRHIGAFLKSRGKPDFARFIGGPNDINRRANYIDVDAEPSGLGNADKRNVAALARLGRLNAVRYGSFQPQYSGKRGPTSYKELNDGLPSTNENEITENVDDCEDDEETDSNNNEDNFTHPNWIQSQKKRYVAALARSGRLPIWHPQRMWGAGKRDIPRAYWMRYRSGARSLNDKRQNTIDETPNFVQPKDKKCRKSAESVQQEKRNLAMLARKGVLSSPYVSA